MRPTGDMTTTTDEVIDRFNRAFQERDATLLEDIIAPDCVMESIQPAPDGTWTGLDGYYTGEVLRLVRGADGAVDHLDLGSFVFTRAPYGPGAPLAARPDPEGWRSF